MTWRWLFWWRPPALYRTVFVPLVSDKDAALRGVLWRSRGAWLVLRRVMVHKPPAAPTQLDGEVLVHRSNVSFIQVLPDDRL